MRTAATALVTALLLCACDEPSPPAGTASATATPSAAPSALKLPDPVEVNREGERKLAGEEESVILLTINEAREVLYTEGWGRAGGARSAGGFVLSTKKDDRSVRIQWTRFNDGVVSESKLAVLSQDAVWSIEQEDAAVAVSVKKGDELDVEASEQLLKKLVIRGADDTPTFALVPSTPTTKLKPALDDDGKAMSKASVDALVEALKKAGRAGAKVTEEQKHDPEGTKVAMPSATVTAGDAEVMMRCARPRVPMKPKPVDAGVGGAITLQGSCSIVVWVGRTDDKPSDKAKAEALLKKLLG